ncbi:MAG: hypothetical protein ACE5ID_04650 [Acidobacteriota bacterium]
MVITLRCVVGQMVLCDEMDAVLDYFAHTGSERPDQGQRQQGCQDSHG